MQEQEQKLRVRFNTLQFLRAVACVLHVDCLCLMCNALVLAADNVALTLLATCGGTCVSCNCACG